MAHSLSLDIFSVAIVDCNGMASEDSTKLVSCGFENGVMANHVPNTSVVWTVAVVVSTNYVYDKSVSAYITHSCECVLNMGHLDNYVAVAKLSCCR